MKFRPYKTNSARITAMWSFKECMWNYEESIFSICCDLDKRLAICKEVLSLMPITGTTVSSKSY
jgi:hypothetical protein